MEPQPPPSDNRANIMKPPNPPKRRSSITTVILEEMGPSFNPRKSIDSLKNPPSVRGSQKDRLNVGRIAEEATPVYAAGHAARPGRMNPQSAPNDKARNVGLLGRSLIPTPLTSRGITSKTVVRAAPSTLLSRVKLPAVGQRGGSQGFAVKKRPPPERSNSNLTSAFSSARSGKKGPKRSTSMESFAFSFMNSTCVTPGNPRRLSGFGFGLSTGKKLVFCTKSTENLHRSSGYEPVQKTLKVPSSADKKFVNRMIFVVLDVLQDFEYPKMMSVSDFNKMSVMEFFNICQFFLQGIKCPKFSGSKVDEFIPQLLEATHALKYPGTLKKSVLQTVNTPHSWPAAVTFLVWLSCRITAMCTPRSFGSKMNSVAALGADGELRFTELVSESYRRMFAKCVKGVDEELEREKQEYRKSIMEAYLFGHNESVQSLTEIWTERQNQMSVLAAATDPSVEVLANTKASLDKVAVVQSKQVEAANLLLKYRNTEHHRSQSRTLEKKIAAEQDRCGQISVQIQQQPFDLEGMETLMAEVEGLKNQQNALLQVIELMKNKLKMKQNVTKNHGNLFYQVCAKFRIADGFNEHLVSLEKAGLVENMERIQMNPFNQTEFAIWLKDLRRILRHTERIISELKLNLQHGWKHEEKLKRENISEDIERFEAESAAINLDIQNIREEGSKERHNLKMVEAARMQEIKEVQQLIGKIEKDIRGEEIEIEELTRIMNIDKERSEKLEEEVEASDTAVEEAYYESRAQKCSAYEKHYSDVAKVVLERRARFPNILDDNNGQQ